MEIHIIKGKKTIDYQKIIKQNILKDEIYHQPHFLKQKN